MMLIVQDAEPPTCLAVYAGASEAVLVPGRAVALARDGGCIRDYAIGWNVGLQARRLL
jgi:hypothetical protein